MNWNNYPSHNNAAIVKNNTSAVICSFNTHFNLTIKNVHVKTEEQKNILEMSALDSNFVESKLVLIRASKLNLALKM